MNLEAIEDIDGSGTVLSNRPQSFTRFLYKGKEGKGKKERGLIDIVATTQLDPNLKKR